MKKRLAFAATVAMLAGLAWAWCDYRRTVDGAVGNRDTVIFEIAKGESMSRITRRLAEQAVLRKPHWFVLYAHSQDRARRIKYGEYEIRPGIRMRDLLDMLVSGRVRQHSLTLVEGWTLRQILSALHAVPVLEHRLLGKSPEELMAAIGAPAQAPEGRFFPDTYFFPKGFRDTDLLKRAYDRMQRILETEWQGRQPGLPYNNRDEALILASVVEKETSRKEERPLVAGVFLRRLAKGMRLQADPTVIYGLGESYQGDIRRQDLLRDTPYNTYTRNGLPPTPIAAPGLASLRAALHPDGSGTLYFVARGDGSHVFSSTLADHQRAVRELLQVRPE